MPTRQMGSRVSYWKMLGRRSIQELLNDSTAYCTRPQMESLVARLNRDDRDAIEAEWELIILAFLKRIGDVEYEPYLGGSARLDVRFRCPQLKFVADVRTVSDENYDRENPVHDFDAALSRIADNLRAQAVDGHFTFRVNGISASPGRGAYKTKLILPRSHQFQAMIFNTTEFRRFIATIKQQPCKVHHFVVNKEQVSLSIVFNPGGLGTYSFSHPTYNLPHDITHNVVHRALETKADQIKRAGRRDPGELGGVFLCDGGCGMLRTPGGVGTVSLDKIVLTFLRSSGTVDFVCIVDVHRRFSIFGSTSPLEFCARVWSLRQTPPAQMLEDMFADGLKTLPTPQRSAVNTLNCFNWVVGSEQRIYATYKRDTVMTTNSVEISLRATFDYISGRINRAEFERAVPIDWIDQIRRRLDQGTVVTELSINRYSGEDDDGMVITFGGPDPAASTFQTPSPTGGENSAEARRRSEEEC